MTVLSVFGLPTWYLNTQICQPRDFRQYCHISMGQNELGLVYSSNLNLLSGKVYEPYVFLLPPHLDTQGKRE